MALPNLPPPVAAAVPEPAPPVVRVLALSDEVEPLIYSDRIRERFRHVDLVLSCGDLPTTYLEYIVSSLDVPLYGVRGNHDHGGDFVGIPTGSLGPGTGDLHRQVVCSNGLLIAGLEGSLEYNHGPHQYGEAAMRLEIARLVPRLLLNRLRYGRYLDVLVTHAPPRDIHDRADRCHTGFVAFRDFLRRFRPRYHLHGHIHVYDRQTITRTQFAETIVQNVYGHKELRIPIVEGRLAAGGAARQ